MNSLTIAGQLGKDAEQKFLPDGTAILNFSVADDQGKDKPTIWWNCSLFGPRAEGGLGALLTKGKPVTVTGNVTMREYTDKEGVKRQPFDIRVVNVALQGGKRDDAPQRAPEQRQSAAPDFNDDVPFMSIPRKALYSI